MMTREMIKAIRLVNGFNSDLRIKLRSINKDCLWKWIDDNAIGIFGINTVMDKKSTDVTSDKYDIWEHFINHAVYCVIKGIAD